MSASRPSLPAPDGQALDRSDLLSASGFGAALLSMIEASTVATLDATAETMAALVEQMQQIALALQARDPVGIRRRTGLFGRLLGRDMEAQLQAEQLAGQLGVLLVRADALATHLQAMAIGAEDLAAQATDSALAIDDWVAAGSQAQGSADDAWCAALSRRLDHLRRMASVQRMQVAQSRIVQAQTHELLERYRRIRDILLPAWRQQAVSEAAAQLPATLQDMQRTQDEITTEVAAMQARLR
ncbi:hypothetical protein [Pseudoxanthomonas sp.]|uniref:hypothetical protein n=1 Tax=Pseudoxanthomonas sp. TaxID=1871049 RepID=UPI002618D719|nr:hypothetical protein [Pseudoxanthomonas sp.]WDS36467.1 MAG: hypothetical protein O8I58_00565 [Pseudoxanthomonas sp.]